MKAKLLLPLGALLALGLLFAVRAARQVEQMRAELAELAPQRIEIGEKIARWEPRLQAARLGLAELEKTAAVTAAADAGSTAGGPDAGTTAKPAGPPRKLSPRTIITGDAQKMSQYLQAFRGELDWDYGWLFKRLKLTPEQIEKFKDIEVGLEEASMDLQAAIELHRLDPNSAEYKKLWADYNESRISKKAELLGDQIGPYLELYRTQSVRGYARQLAWAGIYTGETATAEQIDQASDILVANSKRRITDKYPGWVDQGALDWPAAREALKAVLTPTQISVIGYSVAAYEAQANVNRRTQALTAQFKKEHGGK